MIDQAEMILDHSPGNVFLPLSCTNMSDHEKKSTENMYHIILKSSQVHNLS